MKRKSPEHDQQVLLFEWAKLQEGRYPELALLHSVPNGGVRGGSKLQRIINGKRMKDEGQKNGVPDIFLPVAKDGCHGLWIEMKAGKNKMSPEQIWWFTNLGKQGYACSLCYSFEDAKEEICNYLGIKTENPPLGELL